MLAKWSLLAQNVYQLLLCLLHACLAGQRQDHRSQPRPESMQRKGYRFFTDDEDSFGLEDMLQAALFLHEKRTFVPAKPWEHSSSNKIVCEAKLLSRTVQQHLNQMQQQSQAGIVDLYS